MKLKRFQEYYGADEIIDQTSDDRPARPEDIHKVSIELEKWRRRDAKCRLIDTLKRQEKTDERNEHKKNEKYDEELKDEGGNEKNISG